MVQLHKYSGAGNTFVVLDGRTEDVSAFRAPPARSVVTVTDIPRAATHDRIKRKDNKIA